VSTMFPLTPQQQIDRYGRILNADDRALCLKDQVVRAKHEARNTRTLRHTEADLPEHISGPISRVIASLMEGRVELRLPA